MALAEAHSLTAADRRRPPKLKEAAIAAALRVTAAQLPGGGWYYNSHQLGTSDTSITCWQVQALTAVRDGGTHWQNWEPEIRQILLDHQADNGSWPAALYPVDAVVGGVRLREHIDSTVYRTALCTLMLEVYYRYLKST